ncbi:MAG: hypothetical protein LH654_07520 [Thermoleophilia bacterium]|nr:hypothetical protein [Thermoleophilia bacterium]
MLEVDLGSRARKAVVTDARRMGSKERMRRGCLRDRHLDLLLQPFDGLSGEEGKPTGQPVAVAHGGKGRRAPEARRGGSNDVDVTVEDERPPTLSCRKPVGHHVALAGDFPRERRGRGMVVQHLGVEGLVEGVESDLAERLAHDLLARLLVAKSGRRLDEANEHLFHVRRFGSDGRGDLDRGTVGGRLSPARYRARVPADVGGSPYPAAVTEA